jgi:amino acid transporter
MSASENQQQHGEHKLHSNVLGLFESSIMGIAGSAPAYSIAATTVTLALVVGLFGPGELFYSGIAMFGVVIAFNYMGKHRQNAGATYVWVRNALHPILGYLAGWSLVTASIIFGMVSTVPASTGLLSLFTSNDKILSNVHWTTLIGSIIFIIMVGIIAYGIKFTAKAQVIMTVLELGLLWVFNIIALFHHPKTHHFSWSWFSFNNIKSYAIPENVLGSTTTPFDAKYISGHGLTAIMAGAVIGAFFYWGWDVTANLNEETKSGNHTAGQGGLIGTFFVFITFLFTLVAINLVVSDATLTTSSSILTDFAALLIPGAWGKLLIISVLLSTVATIETQMIQVTRTLFSMGRDKALHPSFGKVHHEYRTPWNATIFTTVFVLLFFIGSQFVSSINKIAQSGVAAIGIQICFYYALAAISVIILYRKYIFKSFKYAILIGLWPALSGLFLIAVLFKVIPSLDKLSLWVGVGTVALGVIPMAIYWKQGASYFAKPTKEERLASLD